MQTEQSPAVEYRSRLAGLEEQLAICRRHDENLANGRLACFCLLLAAGAVACLFNAQFAWGAGALAGVFLGLVIAHDRVLRAIGSLRRRASHYEDGLRRIALQIPKHAIVGPAPPEDHPYAADLDLFGHGGLFTFLCTAQTAAGEHMLASWLLTPTDPVPLLERQSAVQEMQPRCKLREDLADLAGDVRTYVHPEILVRWASKAPPALKIPRSLLFACNGCAAMGALSWAMGLTNALPLVGVIVVQWAITRYQREAVAETMAAAEEPRRELPIVAAVIRRLVDEQFASTRGRALMQTLATNEEPAWRVIKRLEVLGEWFDSQKNQVFAPVAWLLLWGPHFAHGAQRWHQRHGARLEPWLRSVGELEALLSLGGYAFEHPQDIFAEIATTGPVFAAEGLAHPLLAEGVANDVRIDAAAPLILVSGSNMSGKSTMLRTVGTNAALAWAGGPARARALRLSSMALGATLRVQDNIHTGTSRFYAEIQRLRQLMALAKGPRPLLFLLDEILHGTNSHDRAVGASAVLREFAKLGAVGLVTTHDLALTETTQALHGRNMHFVDDLRQGALHFDYQMRPGVVKKSNALELMRAAGLYTNS